jgi:Pyruvate/2-oxoacid:ferredoxin oxidoreductase delta subunit
VGERPRYSGIFEYISEFFKMEDNQPEGSVRYRDLIIEEQYDRKGVPVAEDVRAFAGPEKASEWVKEQARTLHVDLVGITHLNQDWVFEGGVVKGKYAIVLGVRMDFGEISTAPDLRAGVETTRAYYALGSMAFDLADILREAGHEAWAQHPRFSAKRHHSMVLPPHAIAAGLGRLGRNGMVISHEYGPCVRWAAVTTDLELAIDEPDLGEVMEMCEECTICHEECEAEAIPLAPTMVRGVQKYPLLPMRCAHEFARTDGCSVCIAVCPKMECYPEHMRDKRPWTPTPGDGGPLP